MKQLNFLSSLGSQSMGHRVTTLALTVGSPSVHRRGGMLRLLSVLVLILTFGVGQMWGAATTIASWGKVSIAANTAVKASNGDANNKNVAQFTSTKAINSGSGTYCYYGSNAGGAVITFSNLNLSGYTGITMTFYARASQQGNMQIAYTTNGSTWKNLNNPSISKSEAQKTSSEIPNTATGIKITHDKSSGSLYFGTVVISGTAGSSSVAVTSVSVSPTSKAIVPAETFDITPTVLPNNASNKNINWSTSNSSKATVSNGTVTGVEAGTATITATSAADNTKTATCAVTVYSVTVQKQDETGATITADGVSATATGRSLSASATAASKYVFKGWKYGTAAGTSIASAGSANTTLNGTPTGNVTIIAEFYAPLTATWMVAGSEWTGKGEQTTFARGSHVSALPTAPNPNNSEGCGDKFVGWTTVEEYAHGSSPLYTSASQFPNATTDQVFYAVFADYDE